jgi:hypothetical protein
MTKPAKSASPIRERGISWPRPELYLPALILAAGI